MKKIAILVMLIVVLTLVGCAQQRAKPASTAPSEPAVKTEPAPEAQPAEAPSEPAVTTEPAADTTSGTAEPATIDSSGTQVAEDPQFEDLDVNLGDVY